MIKSDSEKPGTPEASDLGEKLIDAASRGDKKLAKAALKSGVYGLAVDGDVHMHSVCA